MIVWVQYTRPKQSGLELAFRISALRYNVAAKQCSLYDQQEKACLKTYLIDSRKL
ncbi:hypothetical protein AAOGI_40800 [Agarivorans albus]